MTWPDPFAPDVLPNINKLPPKERYEALSLWVDYVDVRMEYDEEHGLFTEQVVDVLDTLERLADLGIFPEPDRAEYVEYLNAGNEPGDEPFRIEEEDWTDPFSGERHRQLSAVTSKVTA